MSLLTLATAVLPLANIFLTRETVNALTGLPDSAPYLIQCVALLILVILLTHGSDALTTWIRLAYRELIADEIQSRVHDVAVKAAYPYFEQSSYHDELFLAKAEADEEIAGTVDNLVKLAHSTLVLLSLISVIAGFSLWLPIAMAAAAIPTLVLIVSHSRRQHGLRKHIVPTERKASYYDWLIQSSEPAAELRTYGLGQLFKQRFRQLRETVRGQQLNLEKRHLLNRLGADLLALAIIGGAMVWVINRAINGQISIGDIAMFYRTLQIGQSVGIEFVKGFGALYRNSIYLRDFFTFLETDHAPKKPTAPHPFPSQLNQGIQFRKVTFHYPGTTRPALNELDLRIPAQKMTAILGPNGSGKSSILKLVTQLYTDYDGEIRFDSTDLKSIDREDLYQHCAVQFQEPMDYQLTLRENVTLGREEATEEEIEAAYHGAAASDLIKGLPQGDLTLLGKWLHEGRELSGGEWHRVATARALLGTKPLVIMDEPTSAMDPWAEVRWVRNIRRHLTGRTLIIITHRVSVARLADHIVVMEKGRAIEEGSHADLMDLAGNYAKVASY